ncbi:MAG: hypothetical protein IID40_00915 [Planctomycetes bacterium]|nr:hypothetical protein [Planctomycetota bacterium]
MEQPKRWMLTGLPLAGRVLLTGFVVLIGMGYLAALGHLYHRHRYADQRPGLTLDDLRANFAGIEAPARVVPDGRTAVPTSRMLEMTLPGAPMRKHLIEGGPESVRALTVWLERGALEAEIDEGGQVEQGDPSASSVIQRRCLSCHNAEDGEKSDTPYGPDFFDADYAMVYRYAAPGTAEGGPDGAGAKGDASDGRRLGPQPLSHLFLVTHIHMLAMPVYTLILGGMVLLTPLPNRLRGPLAVVPMLTLIVDFSCWWLARWIAIAVYAIPAAGMIYGVGLAAQIGYILITLWGPTGRGHRATRDLR